MLFENFIYSCVGTPIGTSAGIPDQVVSFCRISQEPTALPIIFSQLPGFYLVGITNFPDPSQVEVMRWEVLSRRPSAHSPMALTNATGLVAFSRKANRHCATFPVASVNTTSEPPPKTHSLLPGAWPGTRAGRYSLDNSFSLSVKSEQHFLSSNKRLLFMFHFQYRLIIYSRRICSKLSFFLLNFFKALRPVSGQGGVVRYPR